jgi:DNA-binding response OmpR family regulator
VVVIIEDEPATLQVLEIFLRMQGFQPVPALTGAAGLKAIAERKPGAVILDLMLPDIDGYEISRQLRADKETATLPIIMLSARVHRDDVKRGYAAGATRYLKKPVDLDMLVAEVRRVVDLARHEAPAPDIQDKDATSPASGG